MVYICTSEAFVFIFVHRYYWASSFQLDSDDKIDDTSSAGCLTMFQVDLFFFHSFFCTL
jgi:hypothetical protein